MAAARCEGCAELSQQLHDLKTFIAEWFTVLLQRFDTHDRNMHLLLNSMPLCSPAPTPDPQADDLDTNSNHSGHESFADSPAEPISTHNGGTKIVISKSGLLRAAVEPPPSPPKKPVYVNIAPKSDMGRVFAPKKSASLMLARKEPSKVSDKCAPVINDNIY